MATRLGPVRVPKATMTAGHAVVRVPVALVVPRVARTAAARALALTVARAAMPHRPTASPLKWALTASRQPSVCAKSPRLALALLKE